MRTRHKFVLRITTFPASHRSSGALSESSIGASPASLHHINQPALIVFPPKNNKTVKKQNCDFHKRLTVLSKPVGIYVNIHTHKKTIGLVGLLWKHVEACGRSC